MTGNNSRGFGQVFPVSVREIGKGVPLATKVLQLGHGKALCDTRPPVEPTGRWHPHNQRGVSGHVAQ
eukprot:77079-Amphidinium_carterae.1